MHLVTCYRPLWDRYSKWQYRKVTNDIICSHTSKPMWLNFKWESHGSCLTFMFSGVNSNGVSGLFSGVSLCWGGNKNKQVVVIGGKGCLTMGHRFVFETLFLKQINSYTNKHIIYIHINVLHISYIHTYQRGAQKCTHTLSLLSMSLCPFLRLNLMCSIRFPLIYSSNWCESLQKRLTHCVPCWRKHFNFDHRMLPPGECQHR